MWERHKLLGEKKGYLRKTLRRLNRTWAWNPGFRLNLRRWILAFGLGWILVQGLPFLVLLLISIQNSPFQTPADHEGLNTYQLTLFEVYLRYPMSKPYKESGTPIIIVIQASAFGRNCPYGPPKP